MFIEDATLIAAISTVTGVLVKSADVLWNYVKNKTVGDKVEIKLDELINTHNDIYNLICKVDNEEIPLIYTPRRLITQQQEYAELLRNLTHNSEITSRTLDKLTTTIESVVRLLDKIEDRTSHYKKE